MRRIIFLCTIMRGGTSKEIFLMEEDLHLDPLLRDRVILAISGSPDIRQIDGLGGAEPLTSKLVSIKPSGEPNRDVNYTFGAVGIDKPFVDYSANCGNISSAVGPFAIDQGLLKKGKSALSSYSGRQKIDIHWRLEKFQNLGGMGGFPK